MGRSGAVVVYNLRETRISALVAALAWLAVCPASARADTVAVGSLDLDASTSGCAKTQANLSAGGAPLRIDGIPFAEGFGTCANGSLAIALGGTATQLSAMVGIDDEVGDAGSVVFRIADDNGVGYWQSPRMVGNMPPVAVSVGLVGIQTLFLISSADGTVTTGDHADWVNPVITYTGAVPTTLMDASASIELQYVDGVWIKVPDTFAAASYTGTWTAKTAIPADSTTLHTTSTLGDTVTFTFEGDYARFYGSQASTLHQARIYLDLVPQTVIDEGATTPMYDVVLFESGQLPYGPHTLTVECAVPPIDVNGFAYRTPATPWDDGAADAGLSGPRGEVGSGGSGGTGVGGRGSQPTSRASASEVGGHGGGGSGARGGSGGANPTHAASSSVSHATGTHRASKGGCQVGVYGDSRFLDGLVLGTMLLALRARRAFRGKSASKGRSRSGWGATSSRI